MTTSSESQHVTTGTDEVPPPNIDHARILRAIARHRSAKAAGDDHGAQLALLDAQRALEAHLATMRQVSR